MTNEEKVKLLKTKIDQVRINNKKAHIPEIIWSEIISLTNIIKPEKLSSMLGISGTHIRKHLYMHKGKSVIKNNLQIKSPFVKVSGSELFSQKCLMEFAVNGITIRLYQ